MLHLFAKLDRHLLGVHALEQFLDRLGAHHGLEAGGTILRVELTEALLFFNDFVVFHRSVAGFDHDIRFEIQHGLELAQRDVEDVSDARRQPFEEPHVRARRRQLDVTEPLAPDFRQRDFNAALVADHAAMLHALVLAAQAFPVGDRAKDTRAEQAIALRLEGAIVDGLRLGGFAMRPAPDLFRRSHTDLDGIEIRYCVSEVERARTIQGVLLRHSRLPLSAPACSTQYSVPGTQLNLSLKAFGAKV